jgi:8-oxo-dGTP diphosphatase
VPAGSIYEGKIRVRSCGVLIEHGKVLLVQIYSPVIKELVWTVPGGGVEFGESISDALKREFREETSLEVEIKEFLHIHELIEPPFHAVEFYFRVGKLSGEQQLGSDPEHEEGQQLIKDLRFIEIDDLDQYKIKPESLLKVIGDAAD